MSIDLVDLCLGYNFDATSDSSTEKAILLYHRIVEAFKFAYARRSELGDKLFLNTTEITAVSKSYKTSLRQAILYSSLLFPLICSIFLHLGGSKF